MPRPLSVISCRNWQNLIGFSQNFAKFLSNLRISVNFLGFPGIPTNFREILSEKELISADFRKILQKSREFTEFFHNKIANSANFEFGAVQRFVNLVDLEKIFDAAK